MLTLVVMMVPAVLIASVSVGAEPRGEHWAGGGVVGAAVVVSTRQGPKTTVATMPLSTTL